VRLDHLLSKESTARARGVFASKLGELLRRALANRPVDNLDPTSLSSARGTTGAGGVGHHCSVLRERAPSGRQAGTSASPGQRGTRARGELEVAVARGLCPSIFDGARPRPLVENCRASTSIKNEEIPSYKEPTVDALAPDADEGRGWLRKATGSCRPSAMTRGYPNGETRLGSCPVTPA
jgi:hypothetical protein